MPVWVRWLDTSNLCGFFYAMKKTQKFEFKRIENELNYRVYFYKDSYGSNCIYQNLLYFYHDLLYCEFSGLFLRDLSETEDYYEMEAMPNQFIDNLKHILDTSIDKYYNHSIYQNFHYTVAAKQIWQDVYEIEKVEVFDHKPGELRTQVWQNDIDLIYKKRSGKLLEPDYCYLFYDTITHHYKIGRSKNPSTRYKTLLSDRSSIVIKAVFETECRKDSMLLERKLHIHFDKYRKIGEWFDLQHLELDKIIETYYQVAMDNDLEIYLEEDYED